MNLAIDPPNRYFCFQLSGNIAFILWCIEIYTLPCVSLKRKYNPEKFMAGGGKVMG